jgi:lipopolysaccharide export system protein LptA
MFYRHINKISTYKEVLPFVVSLSNHPSTSSGQTKNANKLSFRYLVLLCLLPLTAVALPNDRDQPVSIAADNATFNEKTGVAIYRGNIDIQQGSLRITADELIVTVDSQGSVLTGIAKGKPAHFQQRPAIDKGIATAEAEEVTYQARDGIITLKINAKLQQDGSSFKSNEISYNLELGEIEAKGNKQNRVQLVFPPPSKENRQNKRLGNNPPADKPSMDKASTDKQP